jgi:Flp pilus assembly protein TadB
VESSFLNYLALTALVMLVAVTGGIGYLTLVSWRDRRRQEKEKQELRRTNPKRK